MIQNMVCLVEFGLVMKRALQFARKMRTGQVVSMVVHSISVLHSVVTSYQVTAVNLVFTG